MDGGGYLWKRLKENVRKRLIQYRRFKCKQSKVAFFDNVAYLQHVVIVKIFSRKLHRHPQKIIFAAASCIAN